MNIIKKSAITVEFLIGVKTVSFYFVKNSFDESENGTEKDESATS